MTAVTLTTAVLGFAVVAAALTVTPGLDTALVLRAALPGRRGEARATAAGIIAGLFVWGAAAAAGVSALLTASRVAFDILRIAGALFLIWSGARLLWRAARARGPGQLAGPGHRSGWRAARSGLLTNLLNPKVGVFYLALLPQFVPPGVDPLVVGLLLAGVHALLAVAWFGMLIGTAGVLGRWLRRPRAVRMLDAVTGATLVGFGVRLAAAAR